MLRSLKVDLIFIFLLFIFILFYFSSLIYFLFLELGLGLSDKDHKSHDTKKDIEGSGRIMSYNVLNTCWPYSIHMAV